MSKKRRRWMVWVGGGLVAVFAVWTIASYAVVWNLEEAPYRVVKTYDGFEVRAYPKLMLAETVAGAPGDASDSTAFRRLARYIFGGNAESRDIAMTAPVLIDETSGRTKMAFVLPKDIQPDAAPAPKQTEVKVYQRDELQVAALRFSWLATRSRRERLGAKLTEAVQRAGLKPAGPPIYAAYNPPMTVPFARRNEMLLPLSE
ncbi:MAG: heme-binding protein [Pseudomonadota bacterium]